MKKISAKWIPIHAEGCAPIRHDVQIDIGTDRVMLSDIELGALLNELNKLADIPAHARGDNCFQPIIQ